MVYVNGRVIGSIALVILLVSATFGVLCLSNFSSVLALSSPSNGRIAFASSRDGNFEIYLMDSDGTNEERLTNYAASDLSPSWSPNGTKIAFVRADAIHVMDGNGTQVRKLTSSGLVSSEPAWSPDGKSILFSAVTDGTDRDIYVIDAGGGKARDITNNSPSDDFAPGWSPDGNEIIFTSETNGTNYGIFIMNSVGEDRRLILGNGSSMQASWSPDARKIVFSSNADKSLDIYTMNSDGSNIVKLTGGTSNESDPSWSPDGTKIIFTSNKGSRNEQVHAMNSDGTNDQRLTNNQHKDLSPEFQPLMKRVEEKLPILRENGRIAFASDRAGTFSELYVMNSDGSNITQLSSSPDAVDSSPKWSPAGDKIAFVSKLRSHEEIIVVNANGTDRTTLVQSTSPFAGIGWSPNGTKLVLAKGDFNHKWIFVMNHDGSGVKRLTITDAMDSDPIWSPDGGKIAFTRTLDGNSDIYVMNEDGTKQKRLTDSSANDHYPRWSPEADQIAFVTDRDGNDEVYVMSADGKGEKNLSNNTAIDSSPSWSPDGTRIIFVSDRHEDGADIHIMDSDGKRPERLTSSEGAEIQPDFGPSTVDSVPLEDTPGEEPIVYEPPLDMSDPLLNNEYDMRNATIGERIVLAFTVTNSNDETTFHSLAILQVRNQAGITQHIESLKGTVVAKGKADFTFSWTPEEIGRYDLVIFVIEDSNDPLVLGNKVVAKLRVLKEQST